METEEQARLVLGNRCERCLQLVLHEPGLLLGFHGAKRRTNRPASTDVSAPNRPSGEAEFSRSWFTAGRLGGVTVPCVSMEAQRLFHSGYELRPVDLHDLAELDRLGQ